MKENFAADVPLDLRQADELLTRYGQWARDRQHRRRCGSAEGRYRAPPNDDDRVPREQMQPDLQAMQCQRALAKLPQLERTVLVALYVPRRIPIAVQLRLLRIPPRLCRERHLHGLRMFHNQLRLVAVGVPELHDIPLGG